jgi:hypothetical protein
LSLQFLIPTGLAGLRRSIWSLHRDAWRRPQAQLVSTCLDYVTKRHLRTGAGRGDFDDDAAKPFWFHLTQSSMETTGNSGRGPDSSGPNGRRTAPGPHQPTVPLSIWAGRARWEGAGWDKIARLPTQFLAFSAEKSGVFHTLGGHLEHIHSVATSADVLPAVMHDELCSSG